MSNFEAIPDELKERDQWLMWDSSADTPRRPHWAGNFAVSWTNPDDWHSFEEAAETAAERDSWGIGYVFARGNEDYARGLYGALDLDGCSSEDGSPKDWLPSLQPFFDADAYVERSPSGNGLHIPLVGFEVPEWWSNIHVSDEEHEGVEAYSKKFFTFTGDQVRGSGDGVAEAGEFVEQWLLDAYTEITGETPPPLQPDEKREPDKSREEIEEIETTNNTDDILDAIDHLRPSDLRLTSSYTEDENSGWESWDPGYRNSDSGKSLKRHKASGLFKDFSQADPKSCDWFGPLDIMAAEEGIISDPWDALEGDDWWDAVDKAREMCSAIPEYDGGKPKHEFDVVAEDSEEQPQNADESGETAVSKTDGGTAADSPTDGETATVDTFDRFKQQVRNAIAEVADDDEMTQRTARHRIATAFVDHYHFVYPEEEVRGWRNVLYVYEPEEGVYEPRGKAFVQKYLERAAGDFVSNQVVNEVVGKIERMCVERGQHFEADAERLVVDNGVLDLHTGELSPLSPAEYHRQKIPVEWNPEAGEPDAIDDFLHDIVKPSDVPTLYRLIAHTLYKEYIGEKAAILIGGGENGKSVFLDLIEQFIGEWNVTHRELQDFDDDGFAANNLEGKLANLATEIGEQTLKDTTTFKKLTGRDTLDARVKFEKPVTFENYASLMFATNEMPVFGQDNHAIWRRWVYVDFPYTFDADDPAAKDPKPKQELMAAMTNDEQLQALLVRCQQEIQRWHDNSEEYFADAMAPEKVREKMKKAAEPIYNFVTTCLQPGDDEDTFVEKSTVRACYRAYADEEDLPTVGENTFGERLLNIRDMKIEPAQKRVENQRVRVYNGIELSSRGRQVLGVDESDDDGQSQIDDAEQATEIVMQELREMVEQNDKQPVPREGLVWRCTGDMGKATADRAVDHLAERGRILDGSDGILPTE